MHPTLAPVLDAVTGRADWSARLAAGTLQLGVSGASIDIPGQRGRARPDVYPWVVGVAEAMEVFQSRELLPLRGDWEFCCPQCAGHAVVQVGSVRAMRCPDCGGLGYGLWPYSMTDLVTWASLGWAGDGARGRHLEDLARELGPAPLWVVNPLRPVRNRPRHPAIESIERMGVGTDELPTFTRLIVPALGVAGPGRVAPHDPLGRYDP